MAIGGPRSRLVLAYAAIGVFQRLEFPTDFPLKLTFALDTRAFVVGAAAALACALLASLVPAWLASRTDLVQVFKSDGGSRIGRLWGRQVLVGAQLAVALVLLTVSVVPLSRVRLRAGRRARVPHRSLPDGGGASQAWRATTRTSAEEFYRQLKERTQALPGVRSVTLSSAVPMKVDTFQQTPSRRRASSFRRARRTCRRCGRTWTSTTSRPWTFRSSAGGRFAAPTPRPRRQWRSSTKPWPGATGRNRTCSASACGWISVTA